MKVIYFIIILSILTLPTVSFSIKADTGVVTFSGRITAKVEKNHVVVKKYVIKDVGIRKVTVYI